jgi:hypothetical protein
MLHGMQTPSEPDTDRRLLRQAAWLTLAVWGLDATLNIMPRLFAGDLKATTAVSLAVLSTTGMALSPAVYAAVNALRGRSTLLRYGGLALISLAGGAGVGIADLTLGGWLRQLVEPAFAEPEGKALVMRAVGNALAYGWMFALLGALYMMVAATRTMVEHERQLASARTRAAEAENQATAARLAALRYQLNPHFLFNTLNAVSSAVITRRNDEAESMLEKLAGFLRVTLAADPQGLIPLEDELATIQAYLEIESVRFRDRLGVDFSCPDDLRGAVVPSFILQPLIENAVKHGVSRSTGPVTIRLEVARDGDDLVVLVEDDAERRGEPAKGAGVGLTNIRDRLAVLYGPRGVLQTTARERGFLAMIRMPLIQSLRARASRAA